jgi:hypothetical protein
VKHGKERAYKKPKKTTKLKRIILEVRKFFLRFLRAPKFINFQFLPPSSCFLLLFPPFVSLNRVRKEKKSLRSGRKSKERTTRSLLNKWRRR